MITAHRKVSSRRCAWAGFVFGIAAMAGSAHGQIMVPGPGIINTIAGNGLATFSGDGGPGTNAQLYNPSGVAMDPAGNVYIADTGNNRIRKITVTTGLISTIAGTGIAGDTNDGQAATNAEINGPTAIAFDSAGNLYFVDAGFRVREVTASTGVISTVTGSGGTYGTSATSVAVDASGDIYFSANGTEILMLTPSTGNVTTIAGIGYDYGYSGDGGLATNATLNNPANLRLDSSGNLYIADIGNARVRKVTISTGIITTVAGDGTSGYAGDGGQASSAEISIGSIAVDPSGNLYIADAGNNRVREVSASTGIIKTIVGTGTAGYLGDGGPGLTAELRNPADVVVDSSGNVFIADETNYRIRKLTVATGIITTIAGTGAISYSGDGGPATAAELSTPGAIAVDAAGNLYIADQLNARIREVAASSGIINTIAGNGTLGYSGDGGPATAAQIYPGAVAVDTSGNVFIFDTADGVVREVAASTGLISTVANNIVGGMAKRSLQWIKPDIGVAFAPGAFALDSSGNIYISNISFGTGSASTVSEFTISTGTWSVVAGNGTSGYSGDGGSAKSAELNYPTGLAVDSAGNIYIADEDNNRIRKVTVSTGIITTIVGTGTASYSGDGGSAAKATLNYPADVALDSAGNLYIADEGNERIREVRASTGIISTVAGDGQNADSGNGGVAIHAGLVNPAGVAVDLAGNVYIPDTADNVIRAVGANKTAPTITWATPAAVSYGTALSTKQLNAKASVAGTFDYSPAIGAVPPAGTITLSVTFIPTDTVDYSTAATTTTLTVNKATPSITWPTPATIDYGTSLSSTQLDATSSVAGTFSYSPPVGTVLSPGSQTLSVAFTPASTADYNNATANVTLTVRAATSAWTINTVAGNGTNGFAGDGGAATAAELAAPSGVAVDTSGNFYIADYENSRVRKVTAATGDISTVAGDGACCYYGGDGGLATNAILYRPSGLALDSSGNLYIADSGSYVIRKITAATGIISTVAGEYSTGETPGGPIGDGGQATSAFLIEPDAVALDASGNLYITDCGNNRIRKVTVSTGVIATIAGNGPNNLNGAAYSGDGGPATSAGLVCPTDVALDGAGNIYIADEGDNRIRKVTLATGIITTVAGNGTGGYSGDNGPATNAQLHSPSGIRVDSAGNLYITDSANQVIREVTASTGYISTIAGTGTGGFSGDGGPATRAQLYDPESIALGSAGNIFIADLGNQRIRELVSGKGAPALTWATPASIVYGTALSSAQLNASSNTAGSFAYSPALGKVLTAGSHTLTVTFTPTDTTDYKNATATVKLTVVQATPAISWAAPADIPTGTALSATQLDASSTVAGTLTYTPASGTLLSVGPHMLSVTLTPTDTTDYATATATTYITVTDGMSKWDAGTVTLNVNGSTVASTTYGKGATPASVAAGLATGLMASSPVTVTAVDDSLYIESKTTGAASNGISYSLQNTAYDSTDFSLPSFPSSVTSGNLEGGADAGTDSGKTVYSFQVPGGGYDAVGNLRGVVDSVMGTWTYSYDTLNRLGGATDNQPGNPSTNYCWGYDPFGNRMIQAGSSAAFQAGAPTCTPASGASLVSAWANYNPKNQITGTTQAPGGYAYDPVGDVTNDGANQYLYDGDGQICAVASSGVGAPTMTGYIYNAEGQRVAKGSITAWSCDPAANGFQATNDYILGPSGEQMTEMGMNANSMAWQHTNVYANGKLLATYDNDGLHFYLEDPLGTRRAQTDYAGVQEQTCSSLPFGDGLACTGSTQYPTEHHFTGKERDQESGNDYFGARYYGSNVGRFMSPDWSAKIEPVPYAKVYNPQTLNLYSYVGNNPLGAVDEDGHEWDQFDLLQNNIQNQKDQRAAAAAAAEGEKVQSHAQQHNSNSTTSSSSQQGHFEYDQKTGQMTHVLPDGSRVTVGTGYSGKGDGLNNPDEQYTPNTGPIPQGTYTIEPQRDNVTGAGHKLPGSMRLDPTLDTDTHGRAGFLIHGDNSRGDNSASNGCIILPRPARNDIGGSSDHTLVVVP